MLDEIRRHQELQKANIFKQFGVVFNEINDIEKARVSTRQVGDIHPNGKWVWTEYAPGKFDWKSIKGKHHKNKPQVTSSTGTNEQQSQGIGEQKTVEQHAKDTSTDVLKNVVNSPNAPDNLKEAAKKELSSRGEEKDEKENKQSTVKPKKDKTDKKEITSDDTTKQKKINKKELNEKTNGHFKLSDIRYFEITEKDGNFVVSTENKNGNCYNNVFDKNGKWIAGSSSYSTFEEAKKNQLDFIKNISDKQTKRDDATKNDNQSKDNAKNKTTLDNNSSDNNSSDEYSKLSDEEFNKQYDEIHNLINQINSDINRVNNGALKKTELKWLKESLSEAMEKESALRKEQDKRDYNKAVKDSESIKLDSTKNRKDYYNDFSKKMRLYERHGEKIGISPKVSNMIFKISLTAENYSPKTLNTQIGKSCLNLNSDDFKDKKNLNALKEVYDSFLDEDKQLSNVKMLGDIIKKYS